MPAVVDEEALANGVDPRERRERGVFYTPRAVLTQVLDAVAPFVPRAGKLVVVDPACGAGAFLVAAKERWPRATLLGCELSAAAAATARQRAPGADIEVGDALGSEALDRLLARVPKGAFELWLGNPPYNGTSPLLRTKAGWERACGWMPEGHELPKGKSLREDYVFFLLRASLRLAGRRGALAFVTSSTLLDAFLYAPVRRALASRLDLREVVDLGGGAFEGTRVKTCITAWTPRSAQVVTARFRGQGAATLFRPGGADFRFRPEDDEAAALDAHWRTGGEALTTLVPVSCPGLKTRFDELLVDDDPARLLARVEDFVGCAANALPAFAARWSLDAGLLPKLETLKATCGPVEVRADRVRAFHRYRGPLPMGTRAHCYLERRLIPRGDHRLQGDWDPHLEPVKLVFNVHELPLWATVLDAPGCVTAYRHSRFAPLWVPRRVLEAGPGARVTGELGPLEPNLSPRGRAWAERLGGPRAAFEAIAAFLQSPPVQQTWAPAYGASRVVSVPLPRGRRA